jgi:hypothetical protein
MAHFAHIKDGIVDQVIVIDQETLNTGNWGSPSEWIQTSYNTQGGQHPEGRPLRKNFAGIGYSYDAGRDAFIPPKPFASWLLNEDTCLWGSPVPMPTTGMHTWSEETTSWVEVVAPAGE